MAAATLAVGVISSQAGVYSQNIVGYVNNPTQKSFSVQINPLDASGGNSLTNVIQNTGQWDGSSASIWNGVNYTQYYFDSNPADYPAGQFTGVTDVSGNPLTPPTMLPGQAFFFNNQSGASNVITYVGSVHVDAAAAGSQVVGGTTNVIGHAHVLNFVGSILPVGGGVSSVLQLTNAFNGTGGPLDGCSINTPNFNSAGSVVGYTQYYFDANPADYPAGQFTGFTDVSGNPLPEPVIPVGGGFFFNNQTGANVVWTQSL